MQTNDLDPRRIEPAWHQDQDVRHIMEAGIRQQAIPQQRLLTCSQVHAACLLHQVPSGDIMWPGWGRALLRLELLEGSDQRPRHIGHIGLEQVRHLSHRASGCRVEAREPRSLTSIVHSAQLA